MSAKSTPDYFHVLRDARFKGRVYEPEADTFLFLDALDADAAHLGRLVEQRQCASPPQPVRVVEIGCGSGTVITHARHVLLSASPSLVAADRSLLPRFAAVDINPLALESARLTWEKSCGGGDDTAAAACELRTELGDLFAPFSAIDGGNDDAPFDVILFNPPYVPTSDDELHRAATDGSIEAAWAGGERGRVVVDRFVRELPRWLARGGGRCYVVAIRENDVAELMANAVSLLRAADGEESNPTARIVVQRWTGESLCVFVVERQ